MKITEITYTDPMTQETEIFVNIEYENGRVEGMTKSEYNRQQAEQSTPNLSN